MKGKGVLISYWLALLLLVAVAPAAGANGDATLLPGWVAWLMVALALLLPAILYVLLRDRGRL